MFLAGLLLSVVAVEHRFQLWYLALLAGWALSLAAARTMILVIAHQCIHGRFSGTRRVDTFVGELVTVLNIYRRAAPPAAHAWS